MEDYTIRRDLVNIIDSEYKELPPIKQKYFVDYYLSKWDPHAVNELSKEEGSDYNFIINCMKCDSVDAIFEYIKHIYEIKIDKNIINPYFILTDFYDLNIPFETLLNAKKFIGIHLSNNCTKNVYKIIEKDQIVFKLEVDTSE